MHGFKTWLESDWAKFPRQRLFPFMHEPGYVRKAQSLVNPEEFEDPDEVYAPDNIYHVTTNLQGVISAGRLKSRRELGGSAVGLLGNNRLHSGYENLGMISATYQYGRALKIYQEFLYVLDIVWGKVKPSTIWQSFEGDNSHHPFFSEMSEDEESVKVIEKLRGWGVSQKAIQGDEDVGEELDKRIRTPEQTYEFFMDMEEVFLDAGGDWDAASPMNVIGFTGDFAAMRRIKPDQIAILQLAVKRDAHVTHVPMELELRIHPQDIAVVRYFQPR